MTGHPAPNFVGDSLTPGGWLPLGGLRQTPIAILFFHPGGPFVTELVREFDRFHNDRAMAPTRFMGVVHDTPEAIQQFQRVHGFNLPILRDPGSITRSYGIGSTPTVVLLDVDHIVRFRLDGFVGANFRPRLEATRAALKELPNQRRNTALAVRLEYGEYSRMPDLMAEGIEGGLFRMAETRGRVIVVLFLDAACSWCDDRIPAVMEVIRQEDSREVAAIAVVTDEPSERVVGLLLRFSPGLRIAIDKRRATAIKLPGIEAPELLVVDREGFVRFRAPRGEFDSKEFQAELRRRLASVLGDHPKPSGETSSTASLKTRVAHVGDHACRECHQAEYLQWRATPHAAAIASLVHADSAGDGSCTPCHTTGAGLAAGYGDLLATASMTNVQCEVCHGPGFDHVNAPLDLKRNTIYGLSKECSGCDLERFCSVCHDAENDPDFDLATALPKVTH